MQEKTQNSQVKGESQLNELSEAVEFITKKLDHYEAQRKKKEKIVNNFTGESFRNVKWIRGTEGITRAIAAVL